MALSHATLKTYPQTVYKFSCPSFSPCFFQNVWFFLFTIFPCFISWHPLIIFQKLVCILWFCGYFIVNKIIFAVFIHFYCPFYCFVIGHFYTTMTFKFFFLKSSPWKLRTVVALTHWLIFKKIYSYIFKEKYY